MESCVKRLSLVIVSAGVLLAGCDSTETRKAAHPSPQALAPTVQKIPEPAVPAPASTPAAEAAKAPMPVPQEKPDPVPAIIAEAEKAYQAGQEDYKAGHL